MYRSDEWLEGHYIDNHRKYGCRSCEKQFIVGEEMLNGKEPKCPYCGSSHTELHSWTEDNELEGLSSDMGCLAICIEKDGEECDS
jgi:DNA-directed RNA polymerase subunit RPC12/RpoP